MEKSIEKVNALCEQVLKLTDVDIIAVEKMAKEQVDYFAPFNPKKQATLSDTGNHNLKVIKSLKNLRQILIDGAPTILK